MAGEHRQAHRGTTGAVAAVGGHHGGVGLRAQGCEEGGHFAAIERRDDGGQVQSPGIGEAEAKEESQRLAKGGRAPHGAAEPQLLQHARKEARQGALSPLPEDGERQRVVGGDVAAGEPARETSVGPEKREAPVCGAVRQMLQGHLEVVAARVHAVARVRGGGDGEGAAKVRVGRCGVEIAATHPGGEIFGRDMSRHQPHGAQDVGAPLGGKAGVGEPLL